MNPMHTADFVRDVLEYNPTTGIFHWRLRLDYPQKWNTRFALKIAGSVQPNGYVMISLGRKDKYLAHRLAWLHFYGEWPNGQIDHINRVRHDNRIANLRISTQSENLCNATMMSNNTSGYKGVSLVTYSRWHAQISVGGKQVWKKTFKTREEAFAARQAALPRFHGDFAHQEERGQ